MPARALLTLLLCLSLLLPAGAGSAHAPEPAATPGAAGSATDLTAKGGDCHPDGQHADPAADPAPTPAPSPGSPECCAGCDCDCPCPIGKGMAIGPAHLALAALDRATGALATGRGYASGAPPLRPPIAVR